MRYYRLALGTVLFAAVAARWAAAQDPYVYFAGNPANTWYQTSGSCDSLQLGATYLYFVSGDASATLPARWTALPFRICAPMTFDSIAYMPGLAPDIVETLYVRLWITGSRLGADGRPEPDLGNVLLYRDLGVYPGNPPVAGDELIRTYYGGTTNFTYLRTNPLGQFVTLQPGLYFAIIVADNDYSNSTPGNYFALGMGAPGGPKLYYTPRGIGSQTISGLIFPGSWQRFRYNNIPNAPGGFPPNRILNPGLEFRAGDPFAGISPWNTGTEWIDRHAPALYHGVLGFRNSQAASGKVVGTAVTASVGSPSPPTNVEVIFYRPGTKQRVARFSMPTAAGPDFPIDTPLVEAGVYDIVVRPIYDPVILGVNCPTNIDIVGVSYSPDTHWLSVRIPNVNVSGTVDLGTITLPNGDTNGDLIVDDADLLNVLFDFGSSVSSTPAADKSDLNEDGVVDDADLLIVLFSFGTQGEDGDESCGS